MPPAQAPGTEHWPIIVFLWPRAILLVVVFFLLYIYNIHIYPNYIDKTH
jgi:hypothetical protein